MIRHFVLTLLTLLLSGSILAVAILQLDPTGEQRHIAAAAFLVGAFGVAASFFTFVFFFATELLTGYTAGTRAFAVALRRGALVGLFAAGGFALQFWGLFGLVELTLWAIFLALIEFSAARA